MNYEKFFSTEGLWEKIKKGSKKAGASVVYTGLLLYYVLQKPDVPLKSKAVIIGALGYFIMPLDAIPDVAAGVGYVDDLGALGAALLQVAIYIDQDIKEQAKSKMNDWFGDDFDVSSVDAKI